MNILSNKQDEKFPLYSECEKKRAFDKNHFIEELTHYIKKPFPTSFFVNLLELEEKLLKNSQNTEILDQAMNSYMVTILNLIYNRKKL